MRILLAWLVLCVGSGLAMAAPPEEVVAARVATRWYAAVKRGDARAVAALTAPTVTFDLSAGGPVAAEAVRAPRTRAALRAAIARWRTALTNFPAGATIRLTRAVGDDWREVGFTTSDESFGELTIRVAHGKVVAVHGFWSWGGN